MTRLYVAGPISADPSRTFDEKIAAFDLGARRLAGAGYSPVPADKVEPECGLTPDECVASQRHVAASQGQGKHSWECYMKGDLRALLTCGGIALLPGWEMSPGARVEFQTATAVGIEARTLEGWISLCRGCTGERRRTGEVREVRVEAGGWYHHDCWIAVLDGTRTPGGLTAVSQTRYDEAPASDGRGGPHPLAGVPRASLDSAYLALDQGLTDADLGDVLDTDSTRSLAEAVLAAGLGAGLEGSLAAVLGVLEATRDDVESSSTALWVAVNQAARGVSP